MLFHADEWRAILCGRGSGTTGIWAPRSLWVSLDVLYYTWLMVRDRVDWLVELARTGHRSAFG